MNTKYLTSVEIPEDVLTSLMILSLNRRQQVFDFVEFLAQKQKVVQENSKTAGVLGLHAGKGWVSNDFDEPLRSIESDAIDGYNGR